MNINLNTNASSDSLPTGRKTALVTGASRGIGRAIACALAEDGWDLVLTCSRSLPALNQLARELEALHKGSGLCVHSVCCDAGDPSAVRALFKNLTHLELLVNNAGVAHLGLLQDMTDAQWNTILQTNLSSVFYTSREAIPLFLRNRSEDSTACPGRIINISSVWGSVGASCEVAYSASKGGVNALTRALAKELAPSGIPVNALACGCVETQMNHLLSPDERAALAEEIPAGRFADPEEIAAMAVQLAHAPAYLTGQIITMDGGWI